MCKLFIRPVVHAAAGKVIKVTTSPFAPWSMVTGDSLMATGEWSVPWQQVFFSQFTLAGMEEKQVNLVLHH